MCCYVGGGNGKNSVDYFLGFQMIAQKVEGRWSFGGFLYISRFLCGDIIGIGRWRFGFFRVAVAIMVRLFFSVFAVSFWTYFRRRAVVNVVLLEKIQR